MFNFFKKKKPRKFYLAEVQCIAQWAGGSPKTVGTFKLHINSPKSVQVVLDDEFSHFNYFDEGKYLSYHLTDEEKMNLMNQLAPYHFAKIAQKGAVDYLIQELKRGGFVK